MLCDLVSSFSDNLWLNIVNVGPSLSWVHQLLSAVVNFVQINLLDHNLLPNASLFNNLAPWRNQQRICPALKQRRFVSVSSTGAHSNKYLCIDCSSSRNQLPVQAASFHAEICRICQNVNFFLPGKQESILGKAHIIAYSKAKFGVFCLKNGKLGGSWVHKIAFVKGYTAWNVHIKQMLFPMDRHNVSLFVKAEAGVENAPISFDFFRNRSPNNVCLSFSGQLG